MAQIVDVELEGGEAVGNHPSRSGGAALGRAGRFVAVAAVGV